MKVFKRLVASVSMLALLAVNFADVNAASPTVTIGSGVITVSSTGTDGVEAVTVVVKKDGSTVNSSNYTVNSSVAGVISITANTASDFDNGNFQVSYITADGDNGAVVVNNKAPGATGSSSVAVSAYVLPILSMSLSSAALDFGELVPGVTNTKTTDITTASNAKGGITVSVASTGLATGNSANDKYIGNLVRGSATSTTGSDTYEISSTTNNGGNVLSSANVASTQNVLVANDVTKSNATTTVSLAATSTATTEAGNYNDTLTFTVTGTF